MTVLLNMQLKWYESNELMGLWVDIDFLVRNYRFPSLEIKDGINWRRSHRLNIGQKETMLKCRNCKDGKHGSNVWGYLRVAKRSVKRTYVKRRYGPIHLTFAPSDKINERPYLLLWLCACVPTACGLLGMKWKPDLENNKWLTIEWPIRIRKTIEMFDSFWNLSRNQSSSSSSEIRGGICCVAELTNKRNVENQFSFYLCKCDNRSSIRSRIVFVIAIWITVCSV